MKHIQESLEVLKRNEKKYCLHPQASNEECDGQIIKAHTIQRNGGLSKIAQNGHVYLYEYDVAAALRGEEKHVHELVGLRNATTFTGFCGKHDNELFKPIEDVPFTATPEQCFLIGYRSLCRELYAKQRQYDLISYIKETIKDKDPYIKRFYDSYEYGVAAGLKDILHYKSIYDSYLISKDYSKTQFYVLFFDKIPDFMCSGCLFIEMDFRGTLLSSDDEFAAHDNILEQCTYNLAANDSGGFAAFSWIGHDEKVIAFIDSLNQLEDEIKPHCLLQFSFEFFENVAISPRWYENIGEKYQNHLISIIDRNVSFDKERPTDCLLDRGMRLIDWEVSSIVSTMPGVAT